MENRKRPVRKCTSLAGFQQAVCAALCSKGFREVTSSENTQRPGLGVKNVSFLILPLPQSLASSELFTLSAPLYCSRADVSCLPRWESALLAEPVRWLRGFPSNAVKLGTLLGRGSPWSSAARSHCGDETRNQGGSNCRD